jgi:hypothetical protein
MKPSNQVENETSGNSGPEFNVFIESSCKGSGKIEMVLSAIPPASQTDGALGDSMDAVGIKSIQ